MPDAQLPTFEFSIGDYFDNNDEELLNACISAEEQLSETKETENSENKRSAEIFAVGYIIKAINNTFSCVPREINNWMLGKQSKG
ncbi:hypothetical protein AC249_AIPGENE28174 [Exaiptasia diaphana]|nr:hypothetical protein AC249_AIPGENE28174 [Exaiptasia diaphana]